MAVEDLVTELETTRAATIARFANAGPELLTNERQWRGSPSNVRFLLSWLSEGTESTIVRILNTAERLGKRFTDAERALLQLGASRGRLRGTLIGLADQAYDLDPAEGEWSVRRVLGHVIATDERYRIAVNHAVERARRGGSGPMRPDEASLPARTGEAESTGTPDELRERLTRVRGVVLESLAGIPDDLLSAPTIWTTWDIDVRFRIHRFAAHDREHSIQILKARQALGLHQSEPQLLLADAMIRLGELEALVLCVGGAELERAPAGVGTTIADMVRESIEDEQALLTGA